MKNQKFIFSIVILAVMSLARVGSAAGYDLDANLQRFDQDTKTFYLEHIPKFDSAGNQIEQPNTFLSDSTSQGVDFLSVKMRGRKEIGKGTVDFGNAFSLQPLIAHRSTFRAAPGPNDRVANLVDNAELVSNIFIIEEKKLARASLKEQPWSGDYWPLYRGVLGYRFMDSNVPYVEDWSRAFKYISDFPFFEIFRGGEAAKIKTLATSEKYDLLTGDPQGTLTQNMWGQGRDYFDNGGKVETWMGICHGWAAAAIMWPRPTHEIRLRAYTGETELTFNPSEIKGILSYLWATTPYPSRFIGGRCNSKEVKRDENGRPMAPECLDTNPATWHLAMVNQIGVSQRGFVMDATADYEVWNQPVYAYSIKYFNPQTKAVSEDPKEAIVSRADFSKDKFAKYRSSRATQFVGIDMEVQYVIEENANARPTDDEKFDNITKVHYLYDLEVDAKGEIAGGEWYQNEHPDFLWIPEKDASPETAEDAVLKNSRWDTGRALPQTWRDAAHGAAESGRVLNSISRAMLSESRRE